MSCNRSIAIGSHNFWALAVVFFLCNLNIHAQELDVNDTVIEINAKTQENDLIKSLQFWKSKYQIDYITNKFEVNHGKLVDIDLILSQDGALLQRLTRRGNYGIQNYLLRLDPVETKIYIEKGRLIDQEKSISTSDISPDDQVLQASILQMQQQVDTRERANAALASGATLIFNGDYYPYYIDGSNTIIVDAGKNIIMILDKPISSQSDKTVSGRVLLAKKPFRYSFANDILVIKNKNGKLVNQYGVVSE